MIFLDPKRSCKTENWAVELC